MYNCRTLYSLGKMTISVLQLSILQLSILLPLLISLPLHTFVIFPDEMLKS